jgi:hypothetical protein
MDEISRKTWMGLPAWVPLETVCRFTGLYKTDIRALVDVGRIRTLKVGRTGKRVRYCKVDVGELCGYQQ